MATSQTPGTDLVLIGSEHQFFINEQEQLDSATANTGIELCNDNASGRILPHTAAPVGPVATTDVVQSNTIFQNAQDVKISGNPNFHNIGSLNVTNVYGGESGLGSLKGSVSFNALHDSAVQDPTRRCHPGTRANILKRLQDWIDNPNLTERIFWLYGPAGAGKSAIAQTIARSYCKGEVAATFFLFKADSSRNDGNRLFPTIAWQLAFSIPGMKDHIIHSLDQCPHLPTIFQVSNEATTPHIVPVIIIDGIDECNDEDLQRQFLKVIGDAVADHRFPLRFLLVSRPEVHIEQAIHRFQNPILRIDLAKLDDANRDIEKYLVDEFSRIAAEQGLDPTWPGPKIISDIVEKSSGNFIFASLVIRFVGDPYCFAKSQLDIVLNMKPPKTMSPFAILDQLFLEILGRVPEQDFLKRYLKILDARISLSSPFDELYRDDAVLMHVSEGELHANLRRMRSLLNFERGIGIYHRSFLDFLHNPSRSVQYSLCKKFGRIGRIQDYMVVFVDSIVRYVSTLIKQPYHHDAPHFAPRFREIIKQCPSKIDMTIREWNEVMNPLLDLQDQLLQLPNFTTTVKFFHCDQCTVFHLLRELMHVGIHVGFHCADAVILVRSLRSRRGAISSITTKSEKNMNPNDLDSVLHLLLSQLPETMDGWRPNKGVIKLVKAVLCFDHTETATKIRFVSDAQKMVDLLEFLLHAKSTLHSDAIHKATLLALAIFARVPVIPLSYFLNEQDKMRLNYWQHGISNITTLAQTIFASGILDRRYIIPVLGWLKDDERFASAQLPKSAVFSKSVPRLTIYEWRQQSHPSLEIILRIISQLAEVFQHIHSMGVLLHQFSSRSVLLDKFLRPRISCQYLTSRSIIDAEVLAGISPEGDTFLFGCLCYGLCYGVDTLPDQSRSGLVLKRLSKPPIPEYVWQLVQRCCAEDLKSRPTINEVVKEIEGWSNIDQPRIPSRLRQFTGAILRPFKSR